MTINIVTGDDNTVPVTLKKSKNIFTISPTATVKAAIIDEKHTSILAGPITADLQAAGTNLSQSTVVFSFAAADTESIALTKNPTSAKLEVQVDDSGKTTWHEKITLTKGMIA